MECLVCYKHVGEIAPTRAKPFTDFWRQFCNIIRVGVDDAADLKAFENCQLCPDCFAVSTRAVEISTSIQQLQCELDGLSVKLNQSFEGSLTLERERASCILNDDLLDDVKHVRSLLRKQKVPVLEFVASLDIKDENARLEDEDENFDVQEPEQRLNEEAFTADYEDGTNSVVIFTTNPEGDDVQIEIVNESLTESVEVADKAPFRTYVVQGHELKDFEIRLERLTDDFIARAEQGLVSFSSPLEEEISDGESGSISEGSLGSEWSNGEELDFSDSKKLMKRSEKLMCSCCGKFFKEMGVLMKHRKKVHLGGDGDLRSKCHGCGKIYKCKKSLRKHILDGDCGRSRGKVAVSVSASSTLCRRSDGSVEASVEDTDDESMLEERQEIYPLNCASCDKVFESFQLLQSHNIDEHESRKQIIKCSVCTKVICSLRSYRNHMKLHQNVLKSCDICDKQFLRQSYIEVHKQQMHSGSPECKRCGITFDSWILWTEHHRAFHPETDKYKCSTCGKKCTSALSLTLHMRVHGERNCVCETCDARFPNYPALNKHKKRVHGITCLSGLVTKCNICEIDFDSRAALLEHKKDKHPLPKEALACEKCGKDFASAYSLRNHERAHEQKKYLCEYCNFGSMDRNELQKHQERMHPEGSDHVGDGRVKPKCRQCNVNFTTWSDVLTHRKEYHPLSRKHQRELGIDRDEEGSFQCELCGSVFSLQRYLEAHMQRHAGKTLFCEVCGKGFADSYELRRHSYTHSEKKPHTCELCGKGVIRLSSHYRSCLEKRDESEKEFRCTQCDKAFFLQASLKHHMKIHTNSDRFECEVCHKKFRSKCFLLLHHRTNHFPEEKLSCTLCPATFVRPCLLTWHNQYEHLGQRDKCTICGYEAKNRPAFTKHMKHHNLGRRFPCELCDKKFFSSDHLRRHQNTHSKRFENADIDNNQDCA